MERRVETVSLRDFLEWEAAQDHKHELSHGRIVAFSGASKDHNHIAGNVYIVLTAVLRPPYTAYSSDIIVETIQRKADNGYRADVVVSCLREDEAGEGPISQASANRRRGSVAANECRQRLGSETSRILEHAEHRTSRHH
jgi:hypothetical protein